MRCKMLSVKEKKLEIFIRDRIPADGSGCSVQPGFGLSARRRQQLPTSFFDLELIGGIAGACSGYCRRTAAKSIHDAMPVPAPFPQTKTPARLPGRRHGEKRFNSACVGGVGVGMAIQCRAAAAAHAKIQHKRPLAPPPRQRFSATAPHVARPTRTALLKRWWITAVAHDVQTFAQL